MCDNLSILPSLLEIGYKMFRKSLLSMINGNLFKRNKSIIDVTCHPVLNRYAHMNSEKSETANIDELNNETEKIKLTVKEKKRKLPRENEKQDLSEYLSDNLNPEIIHIFPSIFMKKGEDDRNLLYLIDKEAAVDFVSLIIDDLSKDKSFIAELNPGIGMLTTELLKAGIPLIHLYEEKKEFDSILDNLSNIYPGRLDRRRFNLLRINTLLYCDKITNKNEVQKVFQGVETKRWEDKCMQVIGATSTVKFIRHIMHSLLFRNSFMTYGRTVFYMAIPPVMWHKYTCDNKSNTIYTRIKVLFQLMFDYKLLGKLKRKAFLPWPGLKKRKRRTRETEILDETSYNEIFVVKFEPKVDIYSLLSQEDWIIFWYFVRHTTYRRTNRVIPQFEKWVPGSGVKIIAKCNHTIFTEFGDLTPAEFLKLFKEFQSWPEYKTSNFLDSMKDSLQMFDEPTVLKLSAKDDNIVN
ncbi:PREDICTED: dimethyladenosine transferase 2, mitochondrial [Dinoponera quadriceps]|uniref:Dimethyladenosine transferase 2, mitochondrial n=1 Tax=Dinoponera quadriceps TaxID=609295 RepID=A0A6P3X340_DINQU|nr:PREDICTED: dimethyladenosine transferase 2, mitochondrial [Dinoponera quadriceps]